MSHAKFFRLTELGKRLFGVKEGMNGRKMHWAQIPLDWFNDPAVLELPDSQRLLFMGIGLLCVRRDILQYSADSLRKSLNLRAKPDLALYMDHGLIEFDSTSQQSHLLEEKREEEIRRETDPVAVAPEPTGVSIAKTDHGPVLVVEPLLWNREAAELWQHEYKGAPPKQFFAALKPLVKRETWERVRPALVTYLAETPVEYVNLVKAFVGAFGTWELKAQGVSRAPPGKSSTGDRTVAAMREFAMEESGDNEIGVLGGLRQIGSGSSADVGRPDADGLSRGARGGGRP